MVGWIKLYRSIVDWQWASSPNHMTLFVHMVTRANFHPSVWRSIKLEPGQLVTGRTQLASWSGLTEMQVRVVLRDLSKTGEITVRSMHKFSIISISNWSKFQEEDGADNRKVTAKYPADNQQITSKQPADNQQITTSQEFKKERRKEGKKNTGEAPTASGYQPLVDLFAADPDIQVWLNSGRATAQEKIFKTFDDETLRNEITAAFDWTKASKKKRGADQFLVSWLDRTASSGRAGYRGGIEPNQRKAISYLEDVAAKAGFEWN